MKFIWKHKQTNQDLLDVLSECEPTAGGTWYGVVIGSRFFGYINWPTTVRR